MLDKRKRYMLIYLVIVAAMGFLFLRMPTAFLPDEDQGFLYTQIQLPVGATQERTLKVIEQVEHHFLVDQKEAVEAMFAVAGFSFAGSGQNNGLTFVRLRDWDQRQASRSEGGCRCRQGDGGIQNIRDGIVFAFAPPAVRELGNATGFDFQLQDRAGLGHVKLMEARNQLLGMAAKNPNLMAVRPNGQDDTPQFNLDIDPEKAGALGLSMADINDVVSTAWGSVYINDFINKGRVKKVYIQADAPYRMLPEDLYKWYVRNKTGTMVPFSAFASTHWTYGSPRLERYNGIPSMEILGQPAPGKSSGAAMQEMEEYGRKASGGHRF